MKANSILFRILLLGLMLFWGCAFEPLKMYPGQDLPNDKLAHIRQIDFLESRPVFLLDPNLTGKPEVRVDDLGMVVLPGTYRFKGYLYHYRYQESARIVDMTVRPGEATFPVAQPVLQKVREEKPYMQADGSLTVKAGFRYGLWCSEEGKIEVRVTSDK